MNAMESREQATGILAAIEAGTYVMDCRDVRDLARAIVAMTDPCPACDIPLNEPGAEGCDHGYPPTEGPPMLDGAGAHGHCDGCGKERRDVRACGRDDNGDPDAPDPCFLCRKQGELGRVYDRKIGAYVYPSERSPRDA